MRKDLQSIYGLILKDYSIDDQGNIYKEDGSKPYIMDRNGYQYLQVWFCGRDYKYAVHRMVLIAFTEKIYDLTVNHKNGNKHDNRLCNLEWSSQSDNNKHAYDMLGHMSPVSKCCVLYDTNNKPIKEFTSIRKACRYGKDKLGLSFSSLSKYRECKWYTIKEKCNDYPIGE